MREVKKVLTIAGSDCSGGAGIQADLKTISAHNQYGMSVITSVTAQNTTGVYGVFDIDAEFVGKQIDAIFSDIRPDAVKIGMVSNVSIIDVIAERLKKYNPDIIVCDPVMISTSGCMLLEKDALNALINKLISIATIITPNIPEAQVLSNMEIKNVLQMKQAGIYIHNQTKQAVLIKGGHLEDCADDLLIYSESGITKTLHYPSKRVANENTHGTGCTLSSSIACNLAEGLSIAESIKKSKDYITRALEENLNLGKGSGPLWHFVPTITK